MVETEATGKISRGRQPAPARAVVPCNLRLEQAERLRRLSRERDIPASILIRQAIDRLLQEEGIS